METNAEIAILTFYRIFLKDSAAPVPVEGEEVAGIRDIEQSQTTRIYIHNESSEIEHFLTFLWLNV